MSTGYFPKREKVGLEDLFKGLVTASHILHRHDVFDAYGHISVRSPDNAATFWMPCNMPTALVSSPDDLVEYHVESAEPVEKNAKPGYLERHIHSEIYKRFPGINSVVHSHASDVLPYCVSGVPLKNTIHMAGFLGMVLCKLNASSLTLQQAPMCRCGIPLAQTSSSVTQTSELPLQHRSSQRLRLGSSTQRCGPLCQELSQKHHSSQSTRSHPQASHSNMLTDSKVTP